MDSDMKWFVIAFMFIIGIPLIGIGISEWRKQDCRVELAKVGKSIEEIKELCK